MDLQTRHRFDAVPLHVPQVLWQTTDLHELVVMSNTKPVLQVQTPPERKALDLQLVHVLEDPMQFPQVGEQAEQRLVGSLKKPGLQKQTPLDKVARPPEQLVH